MTLAPNVPSAAQSTLAVTSPGTIDATETATLSLNDAYSNDIVTLWPVVLVLSG